MTFPRTTPLLDAVEVAVVAGRASGSVLGGVGDAGFGVTALAATLFFGLGVSKACSAGFDAVGGATSGVRFAMGATASSAAGFFSGFG